MSWFVEGLGYLLIAILFLGPILWTFSSVFRYYVKVTVFYCILGVTSLIITIFGFPSSGDTKNAKICQNVLLFLTRIFNIKFHVRGAEHLKTDEPLIMVCNHQSSLDLIGMMAVWPENGSPMIKKELAYFGTFGTAAVVCGAVFVDRFSKENAIAQLENTLKYVQEKRLKLWVFPEGTRNHEPGTMMLPFKKGAFHVAVQAQIPIVPIVFSSFSYFYSKNERKFLPSGDVIVSVLPPIATTGFKSEDVTGLAERTRDVMMEEFQKINVEAEVLCKQRVMSKPETNGTTNN